MTEPPTEKDPAQADAEAQRGPTSPIKEWGAAVGLMIVLALSFYALISMFKRGF